MKVKLRKCGAELDLMFGTDAEFFLIDADGNVIPASQVVPGTKSEPFKLDNGVCHPDGLSLEVGCPPADTPEGMLTNLFAVLEEVTEKYLKPAGVTIAPFMEARLSQVKGATPADLEFGCGSEYDVNSHEIYKQSDRSLTQRTRYSGFHVHLGYTSDQPDSYYTYQDAGRLIRILDILVKSYDLNTTCDRARQYGGLGAFRIKPYGIEYRCMDCSVITKPEKFQRLLRMLKRIPSYMEGNL